MRSVTGIAGPFEYLTAADLCARYSVSRMWIVWRIKQFYRPIKFGVGVSARHWRVDDVEAREAERPRINRGVS